MGKPEDEEEQEDNGQEMVQQKSNFDSYEVDAPVQYPYKKPPDKPILADPGNPQQAIDTCVENNENNEKMVSPTALGKMTENVQPDPIKPTVEEKASPTKVKAPPKKGATTAVAASRDGTEDQTGQPMKAELSQAKGKTKK